jgi:ABC-type amino acid transport substrate-binding protein
MLIKKNIEHYLSSFLVIAIFVISTYLIISMPQISQAAESPHFIVAASAQSPPFSFEDKNKRPQGILIDFWNLWARKNNADITFIMASFDKTISMVRDGKADFHAGLFSSSQRIAYLDFSSGILDDTLSLFVQDKLDIQSVGELKNIPIDVGISREYYAVEYMKEHYPHVNIKLFKNNEELLNGTLRREVIAFIVDYPVANYYLSKKDSLGQYRVVEDIANEKLRAAVKKGNKNTLSFLNDGLKKITKQEINNLSDKWGLRQDKIIPDWLKRALIIGIILAVIFTLVIHWILLRVEVKKQVRDLDEKNRILNLMHQDMMEVNRTVQSQMEDLQKLSINNEQLLDFVAEEMRAPIEKINQVSAVDTLSDNAVNTQVLGEINTQSRNILSFIDKFIEVSHFDSTGYNQEMKKINLKTFFENKRKDFQEFCLMKKIELLMEMPLYPIMAMVHPEHFDELCNNIVLSVIKFSNPQGQISISLKLAEINNERKIILKFRYLSLSDSRENATESSVSAGNTACQLQPIESTSGIRLAIVRKLVQLQGGNISAEINEKGEREVTVELPALIEIVKTYEDVEALLQTGDIVLFGLYYEPIGENTLATSWTHVGIIFRLPGNPAPLLWESTPLKNVPDKDLGIEKAGAQVVYLKDRLKAYDTDVYAIRYLKAARDASMVKRLFRFIDYAHALPFPSELNVVRKVIQAKIFSRFYRPKKHYKNIFCSELVAESYIQMGLLPESPPPSSYVPADFSARKKLPFLKGAYLSGEVMIKIPKEQVRPPQPIGGM